MSSATQDLLPTLEKMRRELEEAHARSRAQRLSWYSAERLAREARARDCVAVIRFDPELPNCTRVEFISDFVPEHIRRCDSELPSLLQVQAD